MTNLNTNIDEWDISETTKFFCKTNFNMASIKAEEAEYSHYPLPIFYDFGSNDAKERILLKNFNRIDQEVKDMINVIQTEFKKSDTSKTTKRSK